MALNKSLKKIQGLRGKAKAKDKDSTIKAKDKAKDMTLKAKAKAKDFKTVLKDRPRTRPRPRTNNTVSFPPVPL